MRIATLLLLTVLLTALPAAGEILLQHDFDDGTAGPFDPLGPGWAVQDGTYHCYTEGFANFSASLAGDPYWTDYTVSFDVRVEGGVSHLVTVRTTDFNDLYFVNVRGGAYADVTITRQGWEEYEIIGQAPCPSSEVGAWHHVEVQVIDYTFAVSVDGDLVLTCEDPAHLPELRNGKVGLVCYSGGIVHWQDAWFDNVVVNDTAVKTDAMAWGDIKSLYR